MTKDEALKLALEALEWSHGGEPMPTKELEAINAIRQALKDQKGNEMTDLRHAAEMALKALQEYTDVVATAHDADNWHQVIDGGKPAREATQALRQSLAEWTPDDTAYRPDGLSQEELPPVKSYCGGKPNYCEPESTDKQCSSCGGFCGDVCEREDVEPIGEIVEAHGLIAISIPKMPPVGTKLYDQPPLK